MNVNSLDQLKAALEAATKSPAKAGGAPAGGDFGNALQDALKGVSNLQEETHQLQRDFQAGDKGVALEQTMVSMQKSQVAFQATLTVRNKLVSAYTDIMNMQI